MCNFLKKTLFDFFIRKYRRVFKYNMNKLKLGWLTMKNRKRKEYIERMLK